LNFCYQIQGLSSFVRTLLQGTGISSELMTILCFIPEVSQHTFQVR
jgi:hypothetical protein